MSAKLWMRARFTQYWFALCENIRLPKKIQSKSSRNPVEIQSKSSRLDPRRAQEHITFSVPAVSSNKRFWRDSAKNKAPETKMLGSNAVCASGVLVVAAQILLCLPHTPVFLLESISAAAESGAIVVNVITIDVGPSSNLDELCMAQDACRKDCHLIVIFVWSAVFCMALASLAMGAAQTGLLFQCLSSVVLRKVAQLLLICTALSQVATLAWLGRVCLPNVVRVLETRGQDVTKLEPTGFLISVCVVSILGILVPFAACMLARLVSKVEPQHSQTATLWNGIAMTGSSDTDSNDDAKSVDSQTSSLFVSEDDVLLDR